jgi:hypothetical protein
MRSVRQLYDKTTEELMREAFSVRSMPRCYKQDKSRVWLVVRQSPTSEDIADWEVLVHAAVNCRVGELVTEPLLLVVTFCKSSINQVASPKPIQSCSYVGQYATLLHRTQAGPLTKTDKDCTPQCGTQNPRPLSLQFITLPCGLFTQVTFSDLWERKRTGIMTW